MCGIHASISTTGFQTPNEDLKQLLCNRGPDHIGEVQAHIHSNDGSSYWLSLMSTVLALRGGHIIAQPFTDISSGSALCWNGEAWKIGLEPVAGNDGEVIFDLLLKASSAQKSISESIRAVLKVLQNISGPFAFVFFDKLHSQIYYGRDRLGRRSLLLKDNDHATSLELSSIAEPASGSWKEVEADAVYQLTCSDERLVSEPGHSTYPLLSRVKKHTWDVLDYEAASTSLGAFNRVLPTANHMLNSSSKPVLRLRHHLCESLKLRVLDIPVPPALSTDQNVRVAVLFSGGLDCTVLARMIHDILPSDQDVDLINVAFENPRVVQAAAKSRKQNASNSKTDEAEVCMNGQNMLVDGSPSRHLSPYENCPDRETGRKAFKELQTIFPARKWRFIAVDVPYKETMAHRASVINLIHPHNTEMDLSIAYALYFAARGTGTATTSLDTKPAPYTTPARVLLSGLGADELFGGYTRHATAFRRAGFPGLLDELKLDVDRLGKRNLGRDDRVISHWGREARFPYLDEAVVKWAVECPIWEKCGFRTAPFDDSEVPEIEPGKKVLRLLAYQLGLHSVAVEKKRAIQFGARTAKMEIGKTKGTTLIS